MLLKRLAFTIYSSEVDQYQKYLPDIQGEHTHTHTHLPNMSDKLWLCKVCISTQMAFMSWDL